MTFREAVAADLDSLVELEQRCFSSDRLSRRRLRHWIKAPHRLMLVAQSATTDVVGYGLVLLHRGTRLARLYSLAVAPEARGLGAGAELLRILEEQAADAGRLYMRLEVSTANTVAIQLYRKLGYQAFGISTGYYEDASDALRMQKRIRQIRVLERFPVTPWYGQTTEFTCGPSALMMAMSSLNPTRILNQSLELDIWREATTIFMTSGHGGCHPIGLALAAHNRGFSATVWVNQEGPLFVDSVRTPEKKTIICEVDRQFRERAAAAGIELIHADVTQAQIREWLAGGFAVIALISTYRMDGKRAPHWVTVTAIDEQCLYVHDPDVDLERQTEIDCQHVPIALDAFDKMSAYGRERLRTAIALKMDKAL